MALTTSSSGGRSARPPTRAPPQRPSRGRLRLFSRPSEELGEQALEVRLDRQLHAVKEHFVVPRHVDSWKVLDVGELAELIGLVLDVRPAEFDVREFLAQREKPGPILDARIAPLGAKAANDDSHG